MRSFDDDGMFAAEERGGAPDESALDGRRAVEREILSRVLGSVYIED